jgi:hypothetical protein
VNRLILSTDFPRLSFKTLCTHLAAISRVRTDTIVVLDNIAKLTTPKIRFLQHFTISGRLRYIAIVDSCLPDSQIARLDGCLAPAMHIDLKRLPIPDAYRYFEIVCRKHSLDWDAGMIQGMARASGGYPLAMSEMAERETLRGNDEPR